eukprot:TRINITY_DN9601_c0_g3_i1.p1 TRINITY_DN9601_c0_g3~~TRINITY_DN9601_c0_g3_i1.p1  ORF type:complete len:1102 (+),score=409.17 TRINITY_DN9601_c0_g3_i1:83-3307(+)
MSVRPADMHDAVHAALCEAEGHGAPTSGTFRRLLMALRIPFSDDTVRHLFARCDADSNGRLSPAEFQVFAADYPRLVECLYYRLADRDTQGAHEDAVQRAEQRALELEAAVQEARAAAAAAREAAAAAGESLHAQQQGLDAARARERRDAELAEAERAGGALGAREASLVAGALDHTAAGICAEKREQHYASVSEAELAAFGEQLAAAWESKEGDLVDELVANLRAPEASSRSKLAIVAEAARHLASTRQADYPSRNRLELLCMALYTMAGPDIDALMTFDDAPTYDEADPKKWNDYVGKVGNKRNAAIFSTINWALRTAPDPKQKGSESWQQAWEGCRNWVKYICLLLAICLQDSAGADGSELYRGLAGLPAPVFDAHRGVPPGATICWPAASSCALDRQVSESYIRGDAANATKQAGGAIMFVIRQAAKGILLQKISKYPKESEKLLPPLSSLVVDRVGDGGHIAPGVLQIEAKVADLCRAVPDGFVQKVLAASDRSAERLATALVSHYEDELTAQVGALEEEKQASRRAAAEVLRTEREVERQQRRIIAAQRDAASAEQRLAELLKLVEEQRADIVKRERTLADFSAALAEHERQKSAADAAEQLARARVAEQERAVRAAEEALAAARHKGEERRKEAEAKAAHTQEERQEEEERTKACERELLAAQADEAKMRALQDRAARELSEQRKLLGELQAEAEAFRRRRADLDEQEGGFLGQEVRIVEQRSALRQKERKHQSDLQDFDTRWRPVSPLARTGPARTAQRDGAASERRSVLRGEPGGADLRRATSAPPRVRVAASQDPQHPAAAGGGPRGSALRQRPQGAGSATPRAASEPAEPPETALMLQLRERDATIAQLQRQLQQLARQPQDPRSPSPAPPPPADPPSPQRLDAGWPRMAAAREHHLQLVQQQLQGQQQRQAPPARAPFPGPAAQPVATSLPASHPPSAMGPAVVPPPPGSVRRLLPPAASMSVFSGGRPHATAWPSARSDASPSPSVGPAPARVPLMPPPAAVPGSWAARSGGQGALPGGQLPRSGSGSAPAHLYAESRISRLAGEASASRADRTLYSGGMR